VALQSFVGPWPRRQFHNLFYTDGRTLCTSEQPAPILLPAHRSTQTQNKRAHRHPCLEWDSNPRFQRSSKQRQFMPRPCGLCDRQTFESKSQNSFSSPNSCLLLETSGPCDLGIQVRARRVASRLLRSWLNLCLTEVFSELIELYRD
jgi:hypothetical protein